MTTFTIVQQYVSVAYVRTREKLANPLPLGIDEATSHVEALKQAAKEHKLPALLLRATQISE